MSRRAWGYRRSRLEVKLDVLRACKRLQKPTQIMYDANLSWAPLKAHLKDLIEKGLIEAKKPPEKDLRTKVLYELTPKGKEALMYFDRNPLVEL